MLLIVACSFGPAHAKGLSFEQARMLALKNSRIIKAYTRELEASRYRYHQAKGGYLPKIFLSETGLRTNEPGSAAFAKISQGKFDMPYFLTEMADPDHVTNYQTKIEVLQPVYMKGKIYFGIKQAREMEKASEYTLERVKHQMVLNLTRAYYGKALADTALAVTKKSYTRTKEYYETSRRFYENGMLVKSDLLVAQSHLLMNEGAIREAERQVQITRSLLQRILGTKAEIGGTWSMPDYGFREDLAYYLALGLQKRQDLKTMERYLLVHEYEMKKAKSRLFPEVSVFASYAKNGEDIFGDDGDGYTVGAQVRLNLFNGFSDINHLREQKSRYLSLRNKIADKKLEIEVEVKDGFYSVLAAQKKLQAAKKRVEAAKEALQITQNRFHAGILKVTDLLDREVEEKEAELGLYKSQYDLIVSNAKLLFAAGVLQ
ncbi:MAG: TolC family protein [Deltaproteobacteria bacterium]|nr:TolC family protein [Deltaproteobacteria bacterium]